jgi:hypothetical protein
MAAPPVTLMGLPTILVWMTKPIHYTLLPRWIAPSAIPLQLSLAAPGITRGLAVTVFPVTMVQLRQGN